MIISRTSQYAVQALIYLATQPQDAPILCHAIAEMVGVPAPYLSKIMQILAKGGLVHSSRGRSGGFNLSDEPGNISLMRVLRITEGATFTTECVLGLKECSDETACPMHHEWKPVKQEILVMLEKQTLATLGEAVLSGKYRICDIDGCTMCGKA